MKITYEKIEKVVALGDLDYGDTFILEDCGDKYIGCNQKGYDCSKPMDVWMFGCSTFPRGKVEDWDSCIIVNLSNSAISEADMRARVIKIDAEVVVKSLKSSSNPMYDVITKPLPVKNDEKSQKKTRLSEFKRLFPNGDYDNDGYPDLCLRRFDKDYNCEMMSCDFCNSRNSYWNEEID